MYISVGQHASLFQTLSKLDRGGNIFNLINAIIEIKQNNNVQQPSYLIIIC